MSQTKGPISFPMTKTRIKKIPTMGRVLSALNAEAMDTLDKNSLII